jgi:hypothetical protein
MEGITPRVSHRSFARRARKLGTQVVDQPSRGIELETTAILVAPGVHRSAIRGRHALATYVELPNFTAAILGNLPDAKASALA